MRDKIKISSLGALGPWIFGGLSPRFIFRLSFACRRPETLDFFFCVNRNLQEPCSFSILEHQGFFHERFGFTIHFIALMRRQGGIYRAEGFTEAEMRRALEAKRQNKPITLEPKSIPLMTGRDLLGFVSPEKFSDPIALVDATGADELGRVAVAALRKGIHVVTANKRPFAASYEDYQELIQAQDEGNARLMHETTVGGGLPILRALRGLVYTGDEIEEIQGCLSGTNGFICSGLEQGRMLS